MIDPDYITLTGRALITIAVIAFIVWFIRALVKGKKQ